MTTTQNDSESLKVSAIATLATLGVSWPIDPALMPSGPFNIVTLEGMTPQECAYIAAVSGLCTALFADRDRPSIIREIDECLTDIYGSSREWISKNETVLNCMIELACSRRRFKLEDEIANLG